MLKVQDFFFRRYIRPGDKIRAIFHRHFFVVFPNILFWLIIPIGLVSYGVYHLWYPGILDTSYLWLWESYLFLMFITMLYKILDWYCDAWIVTERGLVDVEWSLFSEDMTFTEFHDISGIQYHQGSLSDKIFDIGDITVHMLGDELMISRLYRPEAIVTMVQANLQQHHHAETSHSAPETHIYLDGVRQNHIALPYKNGFRYVGGPDDSQFVEQVRKQPGTIDLSGKPEPTQKHDEHHDQKHDHH